MIKHIWSLICKESKIDTFNNVTIIDQYDEVEFTLNTNDEKYEKGNPVVVPFKFEIVSLFYRDTAGEEVEMTESVAVLDPKGNKLGEFASPVTFKSEHSRMRNVMKLENLALTVSGTYLFQVFYVTKKQPNKKELAVALPLDIKVAVNGDKL
jgi:hypothetical protein